MRLRGIGVDVISWHRAERFLAEHPFDHLKRILTPQEQIAFQNTPSPVQFFARSFAAKEAYFKALEGGWMGEDFFRKIEIQNEGENHFRILNQAGREMALGEGSFFDVPGGVGAQVLIGS